MPKPSVARRLLPPPFIKDTEFVWRVALPAAADPRQFVAVGEKPAVALSKVRPEKIAADAAFGKRDGRAKRKRFIAVAVYAVSAIQRAARLAGKTALVAYVRP